MHPETPDDLAPSLTRAPPDRGRRVLLVRSIEEPFNPIFSNVVPLDLLWVSAGIRRYCERVECRILDWNALAEPAPRPRFVWTTARDEERLRSFAKVLDDLRP